VHPSLADPRSTDRQAVDDFFDDETGEGDSSGSPLFAERTSRELNDVPAGALPARHRPRNGRRRLLMLRWALIFLLIALVASAFGMWGLEGLAMQIARILFFVFLVLLIVSFVTGRRGRVS